MTYHLKSGESVPQAMKRIVSEQIEVAEDQIKRTGAKDRDTTVHEVRKSIKKICAVLRLIRPELGDIYSAEMTAFRDLARELSEFRDASAIITTFDHLKQKYRGELPRTKLDSIRRGLVTRKKTIEADADVAHVLSKMPGSLRRASKRVKKWPLQTDGFAAIAPGIEKTFRRGRKALLQAKKQPTPDNFHYWRRRVKDLWYHVRVLEPVWTEIMEGYEGTLKDLETWLGEDHNLVLLREAVAAANPPQLDAFFDVVDKSQKELRDNALSIGERIYCEETAKQFTHRIGRIWDAWQSQPRTLEELQKQKRHQHG